MRIPATLLICLAFGVHAKMAAQEVLRPPITGIAHLVVYEPDRDATRTFYSNLLGWPEAQPLESDRGLRFIVNAHQYIETEPMPAQVPAAYVDHIAFATSDVKQLLRYLKAKGIDTPEALSERSDGGKYFFVKDPEGYKVEFVQATRTTVKPGPLPPISTRIIHAGLAVRDGNAEDAFYKDLLGFRLYWHSLAHADGSIDYVSMQVPEGTDWLEYMQNAPGDRSIKRLTSADHFAPGVISITDALRILESRGWRPPSANPATRRGNDGKWQLNLRDPSNTRVELMEFQPSATPTVPFTGPQPTTRDTQ